MFLLEIITLLFFVDRHTHAMVVSMVLELLEPAVLMGMA